MNKILVYFSGDFLKGLKMKDKWINVKNKLPKIKQPYKGYLVYICNPDYFDSGYISAVRFNKDKNRFQIEEDAIHYYYGSEKIIITHWMELPSKPINDLKVQKEWD